MQDLNVILEASGVTVYNVQVISCGWRYFGEQRGKKYFSQIIYIQVNMAQHTSHKSNVLISAAPNIG